jgi:hypothetical protein
MLHNAQVPLARIADQRFTVLDSGKTPVVALAAHRRPRIVGPAMPLPKDTVGCLTNVNLGEGCNRRYHQHSSFPSLVAHVETRCFVTHEAVSSRPG